MRPIPPEIRAAVIPDLQEGLRYSVIAAKHGVSVRAISDIACKAGLGRGRGQSPLLTVTQAAEAATRYAAGERAADIGASFGVTRDTIWETLRRAGVAARNPSEAHTVHSLRHDALDELTPDAAYWCGFIFTDGTIIRREGSPEVAVVLQARDRDHLVKFRAFLGSTHAITPVAPIVLSINGAKGGPANRFSVRSRQLADRLTGLGRYGPAVDPELAASRDFWRGCIDGDGTVGVSCGVPQVKLVGSQWLLSAFVDFLGPVSSRRPLNVRPARSIYVVSTSYATAEKVVERLYTGASTVLDRKAAAAAAILAARQERASAPSLPFLA